MSGLHRRVRSRQIPALACLAAALVLLAGAVSLSTGGLPVPAATDGPLSVHDECAQALTYPSRSAADRDWLRKCVHALATPSVAGPSSTPTATPTASPSSSPPAPTPTATPAPSPTTPSPTQSPTPSPTAGDWPGPTNTGPTGPLAPMACPGAGYVALSTPGQVLANVDLGDCGIDVQAANVVIRNVRANSGWSGGYLAIVRDGGSATFTDVELYGHDLTTGSVQYAVMAQANASVSITRANFHHCQDCVQGEHVVMTDSWLHDFALIPGQSHVDGFQCGAGCDGTVIRHNRIDVSCCDQTGAVSLFQDWAVPHNVTVEGNWLSGAGFTIYGGGGSRGIPTNIRITDNLVDRGFYGWLTAWDPRGAGNVCSGNRTSAGVPLAC